MAEKKKLKVSPQVYARMKREQVSGWRPTYSKEELERRRQRAKYSQPGWWLYLPKPKPVDRGW